MSKKIEILKAPPKKIHHVQTISRYFSKEHDKSTVTNIFKAYQSVHFALNTYSDNIKKNANIFEPRKRNTQEIQISLK